MIHIEGPIMEILPEKSGVSQSSGKEWRERDVVIGYVTSLQYPKNIVVTFRGAQVDVVNQLGNGDAVGCDISIDAREWQGRWFNTVTGYNLKKL
jgi:hypothetical protein